MQSLNSNNPRLNITIIKMFSSINPTKRKLCFVFIISIVVFTYLYNFSYPNDKVYRECFLGSHKLNDTLIDILKSEVKPLESGKNIFFHETSCSPENGILNLNARQACAIESAARVNPHMKVFVLFASKVGLRNGKLIILTRMTFLNSY